MYIWYTYKCLCVCVCVSVCAPPIVKIVKASIVHYACKKKMEPGQEEENLLSPIYFFFFVFFCGQKKNQLCKVLLISLQSALLKPFFLAFWAFFAQFLRISCTVFAQVLHIFGTFFFIYILEHFLDSGQREIAKYRAKLQ